MVVSYFNLQRITGSEKVDPEESKQELLQVSPTSESLSQHIIIEAKCETMKEEPVFPTVNVDTSPEKEVQHQWDSKESPIKAEPESSVNSAQNCLLTSSPVHRENSGTGSSCASTLSPVRANANCRSLVHTAATDVSPVKLNVCSPSADKEQVDSSVDSYNTDLDTGEQDKTRHHSSSSSDDHSHLHHRSSVLIQPNCEVPTCSTVSSNSVEIDSTRERELDSDFARVSLGTYHDVAGEDSDMDTQVDIVSHSEPCESDTRHVSDDTSNQETHPEEQQGVSTASQSQGFDVRLDVEEQEDQSSSQVDSSEGSIINRDHHIVVADSGQTSRSRHQSSAESACSNRSQHQSAADSVSEHFEELSRPDSGQELNSVHSRSVEVPEGDEVPQQSGTDEVEEGEVSEYDEEHVGSSGAVPQREEEIEEGEIVDDDDSDEDRTTGDSPTSSSTKNTSQPPDSRVTEAGQVATKDDQAVSCSTDSGVEVSSGEDFNHSSESVSDGEVVQSSGITASSDPKLRRTSSQNQITSSDHTSSQTLSAVSAGISSDSGALPTCSSTDNLVGSSNRTAGLFSSHSSSSSLTSSCALEHKEGSSDTEVDSTSSHKQTMSRNGIHVSRSPADVSSSSSLNQDNSNARGTFGTFTSRWQSGIATSVSVDPIPEEPSSSEHHTCSSELPHASTTFLSSNSASSSSSNPSSTTNTSPAPQNKKKVRL